MVRRDIVEKLPIRLEIKQSRQLPWSRDIYGKVLRLLELRGIEPRSRDGFFALCDGGEIDLNTYEKKYLAMHHLLEYWKTPKMPMKGRIGELKSLGIPVIEDERNFGNTLKSIGLQKSTPSV